MAYKATPLDNDGQALPAADLKAWLTQFGPGLRRYFTKRAGAADADDLVQEVFVRLQARAAGGRVENVERYLFTVANHVLISRRRHDAARTWSRQNTLSELDLPPEEATPERLLIGKQEYERMIAAIRQLPPRAREAFIFHRFEEMSHPAIATRMGISVIAVRKLISRAMERIAAIMEGRA